jgi:hypothetical protein
MEPIHAGFPSPDRFPSASGQFNKSMCMNMKFYSMNFSALSTYEQIDPASYLPIGSGHEHHHVHNAACNDPFFI